MTPEQIIRRVEFQSPMAHDGFSVRLHARKKLLFEGTHNRFHGTPFLFVLFTKITGEVPSSVHFREEHAWGDLRIDVVRTEPELEVRLHYHHMHWFSLTCGRVYYASMDDTPDELERVVDRCYALHDDYDYAGRFKVPGPLDADSIDRLITSDKRYQEQLAHRLARVSKGE